MGNPPLWAIDKRNPASRLAHHAAAFESWSDSLGVTYLWNFALAVALYALLAVVLASYGIVRLIASRRAQP